MDDDLKSVVASLDVARSRPKSTWHVDEYRLILRIARDLPWVLPYVDDKSVQLLDLYEKGLGLQAEAPGPVLEAVVEESRALERARRREREALERREEADRREARRLADERARAPVLEHLPEALRTWPAGTLAYAVMEEAGYQRPDDAYRLVTVCSTREMARAVADWCNRDSRSCDEYKAVVMVCCANGQGVPGLWAAQQTGLERT